MVEPYQGGPPFWLIASPNILPADTTTILIMTLLIMTILITLNTGDITYNDITHNLFYI